MDFLDPKKKRANKIRLIVGYGLIGIAIAAATTILLYQAYGFGLDKNGQIVQKGLVYVSSQPAGADIYVDGNKMDNTNTRLNLKSGQYEVALKRDGYRDWQHTITVDGGYVTHYEYPFLFPTNLQTEVKQTLDFTPTFVTNSPDRRWILIAKPAADKTLQLTQYDLRNPSQAATSFSLPASVAVINAKQDAWTVVEWSNDNENVLLKHSYEGGYEYVMLNRSNPADSFNVSKLISGTAPEIKLLDKKYDSYVIYDSATKLVSRANLKSTTPQPWVQGVIDFQTYSDDTILYVTTEGADADRVIVKLHQADQTHNIRSILPSTKYVLNLTRYSNNLVVGFGGSTEDKVFVYLNPIEALQKAPQQDLSPISTLKIKSPSSLTFSQNTRFIVAEAGNDFTVYDADRDKTYAFTVDSALDAPQTKASWMDGHRLTYVSGGKLIVIDFDNTNKQALMTASSNYVPMFDTDYKYVYCLANNETNQLTLTATALRTPNDL